jgi:hypothetical protein
MIRKAGHTFHKIRRTGSESAEVLYISAILRTLRAFAVDFNRRVSAAIHPLDKPPWLA